MKLFRALHIWLSAVRTIREEIFPNRRELMLYNDEGQGRPLLRIINLGEGLHRLVVDNTGYLVGLIDKDTQVAYMLDAPSLPTNDEAIANLLGMGISRVIRTGIPTNYVNTKEQLYVAQQHLTEVMDLLVLPLEKTMQKDPSIDEHPIHDLIALLWEPPRNRYLEMLLTGLFVSRDIEIDVNSIKRVGKVWDNGYGPWANLLQSRDQDTDNWKLSPTRLLGQYALLRSRSAWQLTRELILLDNSKESQISLYNRFKRITGPLEKEIEEIEAARLPVLLQRGIPSELIKIFIADIAKRLRQTEGPIENREAIVLSVCMRYAMLLDVVLLEERRDFMPNLLLYIHKLIAKNFDLEQDIRTIPALTIEKALPIIEYFESLARERGCLDIRRILGRIGTKIFGQIQLHQGGVIRNIRSFIEPSSETNRGEESLQDIAKTVDNVFSEERRLQENFLREENWLGNVWYGPEHFIALFGYDGIRIASNERELVDSLQNNTNQPVTIIALNVNVLSREFEERKNNHWVGLVINRSENGDITGVKYIDPMGFKISPAIEGVVRRELELGEQFRIERIFGRRNCPQYAKLRTRMEGNDRDCGPFLAEAFSEILTNREPMKYNQIVLKASQDLGQEIRGRQIAWVQQRLRLNRENLNSDTDLDPQKQEL